MKRVFQTRFGADGNYFVAAVASLLERPLSDMPNTQGDVILWLPSVGLIYCEVWCGHMTRAESDAPAMPSKVLGWQPLMHGEVECLLSGPAARGYQHSVVGASNGWSHRFVHDPHPDGTFLHYVESIGLLVPLRGSRDTTK